MKHRWNRLAALLLAIFLIFSLSACGQDSAEPEEIEEEEQEEIEETEPEEEEEPLPHLLVEVWAVIKYNQGLKESYKNHSSEQNPWKIYSQ